LFARRFLRRVYFIQKPVFILQFETPTPLYPQKNEHLDMVLTASTMALPDTRTTGTTLVGGHRTTLLEGTRTAGPTATMRTGGHELATTLDQHRAKVSFAPNQLGDPKTQVGARRQQDGNVVRGHCSHSRFVILIRQVSQMKREKGQEHRTLMARLWTSLRF
jgi:hypothetical protein